jgi:hypothetical protein
MAAGTTPPPTNKTKLRVAQVATIRRRSCIILIYYANNVLHYYYYDLYVHVVSYLFACGASENCVGCMQPALHARMRKIRLPLANSIFGLRAEHPADLRTFRGWILRGPLGEWPNGSPRNPTARESDVANISSR